MPLPGAAHRFDYEEPDADNGRLVIAHMNDDSVDVVSLDDGSTLAKITGVPTARGVAIGTAYLYDPATHHVFFPLEDGGDGTPVLRIMRPTGG